MSHLSIGITIALRLQLSIWDNNSANAAIIYSDNNSTKAAIVNWDNNSTKATIVYWDNNSTKAAIVYWDNNSTKARDLYLDNNGTKVEIVYSYKTKAAWLQLSIWTKKSPSLPLSIGITIAPRLQFFLLE